MFSIALLSSDTILLILTLSPKKAILLSLQSLISFSKIETLLFTEINK